MEVQGVFDNFAAMGILPRLLEWLPDQEKEIATNKNPRKLYDVKVARQNAQL